MPEFRNQAKARAYWQDVQCKALRAGVRHPDECPKLTIQGLDWAIPPNGRDTAPVFADDEVVDVRVEPGLDWPEIAAIIAAAEFEDVAVCEYCGATVTTNLLAGSDFMLGAYKLAVRALRAVYDLPAERLAELLTIPPGEIPDWMVTLLAWAAEDATSV